MIETFDGIKRLVQHYKIHTWPGWESMLNAAVKDLIAAAKNDPDAAELITKIKDANLTLPPDGEAALTIYSKPIEYDPAII